MIKQIRLGFLQKLQPRILGFTFGASLLPVIVLAAVAWRSVHQPIIDLEKTRLDDQVLAFQGYLDGTDKVLYNLSLSYTWWTDLFNAMQRRDRVWIKKEVPDSLLGAAPMVNAVKVVDRQGEILADRGDALRAPIVQERIKASIKTEKLAHELIDTSDSPTLPKDLKRGSTLRAHQLLLLWIAPIYQSDGKGKSAGTLILSQILDETWARNFINFSQPTTRLEIMSLDGKPIVSSYANTSTDAWETTYFTATVLPAIQQGRSVYRLEPESGFNTVYAPIASKGKSVAITKIQISSGYFQQALVALNRLTWVGLGLAILLCVLSVAIAHRLAKQITQPINQLAERSKTLAAGDLSTPIPGVGAGGELGQLADAYQEMAQALKALIDNLEQRVAERTQELELARHTLEDRVNERTEELWQKNQQLQQAHDQLSQALYNLQQTQAQLIQTEKMSSLGQMVAGVAHEINNPVSFIYGNLDYAKSYVQDLLGLVHLYQQQYPNPNPTIQDQIKAIDLDFLTEDLPKILYSMKMGTERIHEIVLSLRNFSRVDQAEMKPANIHEGIDSTLLILNSQIKQGIEVVKTYGDLPLVECYPAQLNQVFMNILSNAIDALLAQAQPCKQIVIQTTTVGFDQVQVQIEDNGPGIPPDIKGKLFDPFFTTKPVGKGTGLGLTICHQIVEKHRGKIEVISELGQGTKFVVTMSIHPDFYR